MIKRISKRDPNYEMPVGKLTEVPNFLPPPEELIFPDDNVKVTLSLSKSSVDFFKREAKRHGTKYQKMIREVVNRYSSQYRSKRNK